MAGREIINICGHEWEIVTNVTTDSKIYRMEDVIKCNGEEPSFSSGTIEED